jgi:aminoglycoside phosphotransferase family enzyme
MNDIIKDLQDPAALPDPTGSVTVVQTHISIVFVADAFVYKIKKPVNFGFLDFSTLEKREYYCHREVELNSRLSKDVYLGVLPVTRQGTTHTLRKTGKEPVDYAVKMKRIPDNRLMKSLFARSEITQNHLRQIAEVVAGFHSDAAMTPEIEAFGSPERFKINTDENFEQISKYIGVTVSEKQFRSLKGWTEDFYRSNRALFMQRIAQGRIRDCHGDLHMEHICLTQDLPIFDCIEFNDRFRYSDTIADIAFLLMDLEYHGGADLAGTLWNYYKDLAREEEMDALLTFYKVYRAVVRGKVNGFQVDDASIGEQEKERAVLTARKYFQLATSYIGI